MYISVTLQTVVQEIAVPFVFETVFWLYHFITSNISTVCIKKIVCHISGSHKLPSWFCKLLHTFKFLISEFNKIVPKGWYELARFQLVSSTVITAVTCEISALSRSELAPYWLSSYQTNFSKTSLKKLIFSKVLG